jgi:DNA-binding IclR family transcriptional regulator
MNSFDRRQCFLVQSSLVMRAITRYAAPALEKGLDILEALADSPVPLSLAQLARGLRKGSNEIFRMLNCLERRGYVGRDPVSGQYALTLRLFQLAHTHTPLDKLLTAAREPMRELSARLGESCHLSVLQRGRLLVIAQEESPAQIRLSVEVGSTFDPRNTVSGRLLLSQAGPRPASHAIAHDETVEGTSDVTVLVGAMQGGVLAALAVSWLRRRRGGARKTAAALAAARQTASRINRRLGLKTS